RDLIASGERQEHMNAFGGEDRFWIGPEGGQFSIYFKQGDPFDFAHWQVPAAFDWEPFEVVSKDSGRVAFHKEMQFVNYSGTPFEVAVDREVRLLGDAEIREALGTTGDLTSDVVAFESVNEITNTGEDAWTKDTGLLSVWILGQFNPSPAATIVIPYVPGPEDQLGRVVNDAYFGEVPSDRLVVEDSVIYFSGDGTYRSKIGLSPARSRSVLGSYDAQNHVLTLVTYNKPEGVTDYVNSMWEIQERPFGGDVVNSYNDGPPAPGAKPLGPFYEMETSSPAAALEPGGSITHVHRTFHIQGPEEELNRIALSTLGVPLSDIEGAFAE
ncbi:MAG TPA: DUF6786 family protein, partial [Rhodothermales bacterium]|nr:DUF6786 family protein [Rhodothermales bacterium]